jgi:hypothetical protein
MEITKKKNDVKAIRIGDKIMVFINGEKKTVSKKITPETFDLILDLIKTNQQEKINDIFTSFDKNLKNFLSDSFDIRNQSIFFKNTDKEIIYSKLILRKALQLLAINESPQALFMLSEKLKSKQKFENKGIKVFQKIKELTITKRGNLIFKTNLNSLHLEKEQTYFGQPINFEKGYQNSFEIKIINEEAFDSYVLINPFDIVYFGYDSLNVSRFKILKFKNVITEPIVKIEDEELFDIPYEIFLLKK